MAPPQRTPKAGPAVSPPDNLPLRTQLIAQYVPQLSLADLEAVGKAISDRWQELQVAQQHAALEAHYAHLRALPAGAPLQLAVYHSALRDVGFAAGDRVIMERPLRPPSTKLRVHDQHGKPWRFPMDWLISETEDESVHTVLRSELNRKLWGGIGAAKSEDV